MLETNTINQRSNLERTNTGPDLAFGKCPGVQIDGKINSLPQLLLDGNRQNILDYFNNSWALTEVLFSGLANETAFYRRPYHQLRHPMIFYYAHPVTVYVNKLRVAGLLDGPLNHDFEKLFEVGVDEMRWDDLHENNQDIWPALHEVTEYRQQGYELISNLIKSHPLLEPSFFPINQESPFWALVMGFEHERIHLETSSVLMRELPIEFLRKPSAWPDSQDGGQNTIVENDLVHVPNSKVKLGKPNDFPTFGWDNEYGAESHEVAAFSASKYLITNGEYLKFVKASGYLFQKYWSKEGWDWRGFRNNKFPNFWVQDGPAGLHNYKLRTIFEIIDMPLNWPVAVNYHEALAYCNWRTEQMGDGSTIRLLKEIEHQALRDENVVKANSGLISGSECDVDYFPPNSKGFHDVFGNLWQWCEDTFHPLNGFAPHPFYDDFSIPCFDGEHRMILGGSFISTGDEASKWARFHFRPHFYQHAGFRIVKNDPNR
jgi:5-histidylcysteine sulfoxide synthase